MTETFDKERNFTREDGNIASFYKKMMHLARDEYKIVMRCLAAYHASFSVFSKDISLSYSILVYALETLTENFESILLLGAIMIRTLEKNWMLY